MGLQDIDRTKHTKNEYVRQARARVDEIRALQANVEARKKDAPISVQEDLDTCALDIQSHILRAEDEIELLEHAEERDWIGMRADVDVAIGDAQREVERAYELMSNPLAGKRPEREFSELR
jgi:hypothetical protein